MNLARTVARGRYTSCRFLHCLRVLAILAAELLGLGWANADQPALTVVTRAGERHFTAAELLARPDSAVVNVNGDVYDHAVSYRAVPLLALLGSTADDSSDTIEAQASDGFVSQIPRALVVRGANGGAVAWLAVEDPAQPWPRLAAHGTGNGTASAGPFYLIWEHPERSGVMREQWPYQVVRLSLVESSDHRWPQLAVPPNASNDTTKRGHDVFLAQCSPCHRLGGGGAGEVGPDLATPMSPTQYLTEAGLRALIRDPRAVRTWPGQRMVGFSKSDLPDSDLDALIAYLRAKADNKANNKSDDKANNTAPGHN